MEERALGGMSEGGTGGEGALDTVAATWLGQPPVPISRTRRPAGTLIVSAPLPILGQEGIEIRLKLARLF